MFEHLQTTPCQQVEHYVNGRPGETKVGEAIGLYDTSQSLERYTSEGFQFALLGIPEQIGPIANCGQGGAEKGWDAFLQYFLNLQNNQFFSAENTLLLGQIDCDDLQPTDDMNTNRHLCSELDLRVSATLKSVFDSGLIPIIIGGGHNNAFPIIQACSESRDMPLAVANLDPHSDFRQPEGRHSGNPFRYAHDKGYLQRYAVLGLHEQKNSDQALNNLKECEYPFFTVQQTHWRKELSFDQCLEDVSKYLLNSGFPIGAELDLDSISEMPSSAITRCGIPVEDALYYTGQMARLPDIQYLHLAEGAPAIHPNGEAQGKRIVGQVLSELVCSFIKSRLTQAE